MKENKKFKNGFTMIELLIVMAIIGILTAVIFVSIANIGVSNDLKLEGRQLASAISQTQIYALSGKTKEGFYPCAFRFSTESGTDGFYYKIEYIPRRVNEKCDDNAGYEAFEGPVKFNKIESLSPKSVVFSVPHATYLSAEDPDKTEFTLSKKGKTYKVTVFSSGMIKEGE